MFSFFSKKQYLVDLLNGFVDIHNHVLPGIDDGAKTAQDSINLIKGFSEFGVKNFVCTPHIMHNYYDNTPKTIKKAFDVLKIELANQGINDVVIDIAAEHMIDDNFEDILGTNQVMPIKKGHLLLEMSFLQPSINLNTAIQKVQTHGYFPILAHPERYLFYHEKFGVYRKLKTQNIFFQMNLLSICGYYGSRVENVALKLLEEGLIDFVASDVHNLAQIDVLKKYTPSNKVLKIINKLIINTIDQFY